MLRKELQSLEKMIEEEKKPKEGGKFLDLAWKERLDDIPLILSSSKEGKKSQRNLIGFFTQTTIKTLEQLSNKKGIEGKESEALIAKFIEWQKLAFPSLGSGDIKNIFAKSYTPKLAKKQIFVYANDVTEIEIVLAVLGLPQFVY